MSFLRVQSRVLSTAGGKLGKSAILRSACNRGPPESCSNSFCSCTALLRATSRSLMAISAFLLAMAASFFHASHALLPGVQLGSGGTQLLAQTTDLDVFHVRRGLSWMAWTEVKEAGGETKVGSKSRHVTSVAVVLASSVHVGEQAKAVGELSAAGDVHRVGGGEEAGADQALRDRVAAAVARLAVLHPAAVTRLHLGLTEPARLARLAPLVQVVDAHVVKGTPQAKDGVAHATGVSGAGAHLVICRRGWDRAVA